MSKSDYEFVRKKNNSREDNVTYSRRMKRGSEILCGIYSQRSKRGEKTYRFKTNTHDNTNFTVRLDLWCFESLDRVTKFANMRQRRAETNRLYRTIVDYSPSRDHTRSRRLFAPLKIHLEALTHLSAIHSFNYGFVHSIPLNRFERYQYRKIISDNFVGFFIK